MHLNGNLWVTNIISIGNLNILKTFFSVAAFKACLFITPAAARSGSINTFVIIGLIA